MNSVPNLYVDKSTCYALNSNGLYTSSIGLGLFPMDSTIYPGEYIISYVGEVVDSSEYRYRCGMGLGGYIIQLSNILYLDCREAALQGRCLASMANSATNVRQYYNILMWQDEGQQVIPTNNSKLRISKNKTTKEWCVGIYATKKIKVHQEILVSYGRGYKYPPFLLREEEQFKKKSLLGFI